MRDQQIVRRLAAALAACAILAGLPSTPRAQAVPPIDKRITYILPQWASFMTAGAAEFGQQVAELRARIGEGPRVRVGFTTYVFVTMTPVDPADGAAVRSALAGTFAAIDAAIARGRANGIPICLSFVTAIRGSTDPLQDAAQAEDRRNMQWHSDHSLANGWTTLSRYARRQEAIQEAFGRELGRFLASRMVADPDTLVAASGDAEVELSYERSFQFFPDRAPRPEDSLIADYSPFAVAEFRDWLRGAGLYAAGQPFAGESYRNSARYAADASLGTLNADFAQTFATWALAYEDWSLSDPMTADPRCRFRPRCILPGRLVTGRVESRRLRCAARASARQSLVGSLGRVPADDGVAAQPRAREMDHHVGGSGERRDGAGRPLVHRPDPRGLPVRLHARASRRSLRYVRQPVLDRRRVAVRHPSASRRSIRTSAA